MLGPGCSPVLFKREGPGIVPQIAMHLFFLVRMAGPGRNSSIVSNLFFLSFFFFNTKNITGFGKIPNILYQVLFSFVLKSPVYFKCNPYVTDSFTLNSSRMLVGMN